MVMNGHIVKKERRGRAGSPCSGPGADAGQEMITISEWRDAEEARGTRHATLTMRLLGDDAFAGELV
jgi:hypothetical protein